MIRLESEIPLEANTGEAVYNNKGQLVRIGIYTPDPHVAGVCKECGRVMEWGWDTVCAVCHSVLCYAHSHTATSKWMCKEDFE